MFTINPIQIFLSDATKSAIVTLRNTSPETLRVQLSIFAWEQSPEAEMRLLPTADIVFFPKLLTLASREERKIRVGASTTAGATEKTYRLFLEELPPLDRGGAAPGGAQVRVLTRVGIPIFVQPVKRVVAGRIEGLVVRRGRLGFRLLNAGNVHLLPQNIRVTGRDGTGQVILNREIPGWYVLAAGMRVFDLELPHEDCLRLREVAVEARTVPATLTDRIETVPTACGP